MRRVWKIGLFSIAAASWPIALLQTRPLPDCATQTIGSSFPVFFGSLLLSEYAVASTVMFCPGPRSVA